MAIDQTIFSRTELLLGNETMRRIAQQRVIIFGVGGVGSWCAESLVRSGIGQLTIVDCDRVSISNVNRQLMATTDTIGQVKVEVLKQRLLSINPDCKITAQQKVFCQETAAEFFPLPAEGEEATAPPYDYVIDAIDSLKDKALLIRLATASGATFFSSMGAALKADPTRIRITEFWKVQGDPLARALRKRFKRDGQYPKRKFLCVYSDELLQNQGTPPEAEDDHTRLPNGTLMHITAIFGLMLASLVINDIR